MNRTFYGKDKKGGYKVWKIEVRDNDIGVVGDWQIEAYICVTHGQEGGEMQQKIDTIHKGKQGRGPYDQALLEANAKIKKKMQKDGYRETKAELEDLPLRAMLAENAHHKGHLIRYEEGVDLSDKLDGLRLLAKRTEDDVELESRGGEHYDVPHIKAELMKVMKPGDVLDGEIYLHGQLLQDITSAAKRTDTQGKIDEVRKMIEKKGEYYRRPPKKGIQSPTLQEELEQNILIHEIRPQLQYVMFDKPSDKIWRERLADLQEYAKLFNGSEFIKLLTYTRVYSEDEMKALHADAVIRGFEGEMVRNPDGLYESGKRSNDLQKYKHMVDDEIEDTEFLIVGMKADKQGNGIYVCKNNVNDLTFTVVMGSMADRLEALENADKIVGAAYLTVAFQTRYKNTLLPQFPTGKGIRYGKVVDGVFVPSH